MSFENELELEKIFKIENPDVEETLQWAKNSAHINVEHLRSCLVAGGKFCNICLSLSDYYEKNLVECRKLIDEGKGDTIIYEKRLPLLEIGERTNNLSGYLALLQMDAMMSLINMLEAKSDVERIMICKHSYTIIHDAKIMGLFSVVSKEMRELPVEVLPKDRRDELWQGIKNINRLLLSEDEAARVRNNVDAHKSSSFKKQIVAYKQCEFGKSVENMFALMNMAWIIQKTMGVVQQNLNVLEKKYVDMVQDRIKMWEDLRKEIENMEGA